VQWSLILHRVIPAIHETEISWITVGGPLGKEFTSPYLGNTKQKKGLAEWLKW
jgi:hypothetical protein